MKEGIEAIEEHLETLFDVFHYVIPDIVPSTPNDLIEHSPGACFHPTQRG